jgi:hypothetical protein
MSCHTAVEGEACYTDVIWAKETGIKQHPEWYSAPCAALGDDSLFEEFQACVFKINSTTCPLPCSPAKFVLSKKDPLASTTIAPESIKGKQTHSCHTATKGEKCHDEVMEAMSTGIEKSPDDFPGLTSESGFEEFQMVLSKLKDSYCAEPCDCHTAMPGEKCHEDVVWAMTEGIKAHPKWYPGLSGSHTFEAFQAFLHKDTSVGCPKPCISTKGAPAEEVSTSAAEDTTSLTTTSAEEEEEEDEEAETTAKPTTSAEETTTASEKEKVASTTTTPEAEDKKETSKASAPSTTQAELATTSLPSAAKHSSSKSVSTTGANRNTTKGAGTTQEATKPKSTTTRKPPCHTAVEGDKCYMDVMYGMTKGLYENPDWYPGLDKTSTFEDFQKLLSANPKLDCSEPCQCKTAEPDSDCMGSMKWVLQEGIKSKPHWYGSLTETSRFEEVQMRLHADRDSDCGMPCTPKVWEKPSLFCWSLYRADGYEVDLVKTHVEKMVGIFACDEFLPLCNEVLQLGNGIQTTQIKTADVGVSKDGTAANTLVFMHAWEAVYQDFRYHAHDWILKVDPDAVLLPHRLRPMLAKYPSTVYIKNCNKYDGEGWPMMFGSLEAISTPALQLYYDNAERCRTELEWEAWGEDLWLGNCLDMLGAQSVGDFNVIGDNVCTGADCSDGIKGTYHPFKSSETWFECYNTAMGVDGKL